MDGNHITCMPLPKILRTLTQVFLTVPCPLCQRSASSSPLCNGCYQQLLACQWLNCRSENAARSSANQLAGSGKNTLSVCSWGKYQNALKQTLTLLKYGNQAELGFWLGCLLGQYWQSNKAKYYGQPVAAIPIPLHNQRLRQRGYNQAALIAQGFCRVTRISLAEYGLVRVRATEAMHRLGETERKINLTGAFRLGGQLPSIRCSILLIDDIYTTGATANMAALPLRQAGYNVIGIATVAQAVLSSHLL